MMSGVVKMIGYYFGASLAPCAVGLMIALGFIKWRWKLKLAGKIKMLSFVISIVLSTILMPIFEDIQGSNVVIPTALAFLLTILIGSAISKNKQGIDEQEL